MIDYKEIHKKAFGTLIKFLILIAATLLLIGLVIALVSGVVFMVGLLVLTFKTYGLSLLAFCVILYGLTFFCHAVGSTGMLIEVSDRFGQWWDRI